MTMLTASYLHYTRGLVVAIVDCDFPIRSIRRTRDREMSFVENSVHHQRMMTEQFKATGQRIYPVIPSTPADSFDDLRGFLKNDNRDFDLIIFDLPGTTNTAGVLHTIAQLDHVFIPISCDPLVIESTLLLVGILTESIMGRPRREQLMRRGRKQSKRVDRYSPGRTFFFVRHATAGGTATKKPTAVRAATTSKLFEHAAQVAGRDQNFLNTPRRLRGHIKTF